jgi:RNA-directed DNA polymerase
MAKEGSGLAAVAWNARRSALNSVAPWPEPEMAQARVLGIQQKLHKWAVDDQDRRFDDLHNLVCDPATLMVAWQRVRANRGSRSAGVDRQNAYDIERRLGVERFLAGLREELRAQSFRPAPVKERLIPKRGGKFRRLGIATVRDRVVQAALKLVLEPIFEADFQPCSYGFRPGRRAQDAIAEVRHFATRSYEWVLEADIEACFDGISHSALLDRVRDRVGDKRVLSLIKAFLRAGIMTEHAGFEDTVTGTPQGGILSPLMANIALSALDEHFARAWTAMGSEWERRKRRARGEATFRLVRYCDDFVVVVSGQRHHADALIAQTATVLAPLGLTLSKEKTRITHIDEGIEFLGWRIQRHRTSNGRSYVYTYASKPSLAAVKRKVKAITRCGHNQTLGQLLHGLNPVLRGWCAYFRGGVSGRTFSYLRAYTWRRVICWLRRKHPNANWRWLKRRYLPRWWPTDGEAVLYDPGAVHIEWYRYRGAKIPTPWAQGRFQRDPQQILERLQTLIAQ